MRTDGRTEGIIMKGVGGLYTVRPDFALPDGERHIVCPARGKFRHEKVSPLAGDRVVLEREGESWAIGEIVGRKNALRRPTVANVTHLVAVIPAARPKPDPETADKLICCAESAGIEPVIVINKSDLAPEEARRLAEVYRLAGFEVFLTSAQSGEGVAALGEYFGRLDEGATVVFSGASGAGKSTLMTHLFPELRLRTGDVSRKSERGRHTTRTAELFEVSPGLYLADTPGFTMLDFANYNFFPSAELSYLFREFLPYIGECRYTKCTHLCEDGCAVCAARDEGKIPADRHRSYVNIYAEMKKTPDWARKKL